MKFIDGLTIIVKIYYPLFEEGPIVETICTLFKIKAFNNFARFSGKFVPLEQR